MWWGFRGKVTENKKQVCEEAWVDKKLVVDGMPIFIILLSTLSCLSTLFNHFPSSIYYANSPTWIFCCVFNVVNFQKYTNFNILKYIFKVQYQKSIEKLNSNFFKSKITNLIFFTELLVLSYFKNIVDRQHNKKLTKQGKLIYF